MNYTARYNGVAVVDHVKFFRVLNICKHVGQINYVFIRNGLCVLGRKKGKSKETR